MLHCTDVDDAESDAESSQAFQTKLAGTNGAALVVGAASVDVELDVSFDPQPASTSNEVSTVARVNV